MALSPLDRAYYEEKLGWKSALYLFGATTVIGTIGWPLLLFFQDWSVGLAANWTPHLALALAVNGFLFGFLVSVIMYFLFRFFLWMGWLPARR